MVIVNNKGFSMIELLAIVIIITIVALISIPIFLNVVNTSKASQYRKSIDTYGNDIKTALEKYQSDHDGEFTTNYEDLNDYITISNKNVKCNKVKISVEGNIRVSNCSVDGSKVLDENGNAYIYTTAVKK